ncbi:conserved repeat domain protein, partial [Vibrio parahaemolyticus 10296]
LSGCVPILYCSEWQHELYI